MTVRGLRCRPLTLDLGPGPSAPELVRRAADRPGLVALIGQWADGTPVLTSHPVAEAGTAAVLARQPAVIGAEAGFLGGGWFGRLAFDGPSRLAFHDHVVRLVDGRWRFEALAGDDRADGDGADRLEARAAEWRALIAGPPADRGWRMGEVDGPPAADHLAAVERAVELIRAGELYQVNVCTRLHARFQGSAAGMFADVTAELAPAYAAFVAGTPAVVSLSPELFLRRRGRTVQSAPIKGTLPRDVPGNDRALRRSAKDVAENVMIVDLVRNDLGRVSETGSVRPTALLEVQPAPGVWHLVSTVQGRLRADVSDADLVAAAFPPGSVTGAPKLRALAAIAALEPVPRRTYTGAIGFAGPVLGAEFSVAIRTFEVTGRRLELGVGGGITADSVPMLEWQECLHKAAPLLRAARTAPAPGLGRPEPRATAAQAAGGLVETVLAVAGRPLRLADHLARLDRSARELYGAGIPHDLADRVRTAAASVPTGRAALRVVLARTLVAEVTAAAIGAPPGPAGLGCVARPDGLWRHKWADRSWASASALYVADDGSVLETERGNVFLVTPEGALVTPPLRHDLLPGVTRRAVLDVARDLGRPTELRAFTLAEMLRHAAFWTSSLSGAVPVARLDGVALPRADALVADLAARLFGGGPPVR